MTPSLDPFCDHFCIKQLIDFCIDFWSEIALHFGFNLVAKLPSKIDRVFDRFLDAIWEPFWHHFGHPKRIKKVCDFLIDFRTCEMAPGDRGAPAARRQSTSTRALTAQNPPRAAPYLCEYVGL